MAPRKRRRLAAPIVAPVAAVEDASEESSSKEEVKEQGASTSKEDSEESPLSSFERLTEDAKWLIYRLAPEALIDLRRTSQTMRKSVSEWATLANLPPIELIINVSHCLRIEMEVSPAVYDCFPCLHVFKEGGCATASRPTTPGKLLLHTEFRECGIRLVREHLPIRFRRLELCIDEGWCSQYGEAVRKLLARVREIGELVVTMDNFGEHCRILIDALTTKHRIRRLKLKVAAVSITNRADALVDLAGRVSDIELRQQPIARLPGVMFGLRDADWGRMAVQMFERGVTRVTLHNKHHLGFITRDDIDTVRKFLSSAPSKHVFITTFGSHLLGGHIPDLELSVNQIAHYKLGRFKHSDINLHYVHYLRYRHEVLDGDVIDDERQPMPTCQPYPGWEIIR